MLPKELRLDPRVKRTRQLLEQAFLELLEEKLGKKVNISAIHVALKRMENKGFVESNFGGITSERGGRRKKYYSITSLGKKMLDRQYELRTSIYQQIPEISFGQ